MTSSLPWAEDAWFSPDKFEQHFPWAIAAVLLLVALLGIHVLLAGLLANVAGVLVELVEWWRFARWVRRKAPRPQPWLCDAPSYRDLAWNLAGSVIGVLAVHTVVQRL